MSSKSCTSLDLCLERLEGCSHEEDCFPLFLRKKDFFCKVGRILCLLICVAFNSLFPPDHEEDLELFRITIESAVGFLSCKCVNILDYFFIMQVLYTCTLTTIILWNLLF